MTDGEPTPAEIGSEKMPKDDDTITQESPLVIQFPGDLLDYFAGKAMQAMVREFVGSPNDGRDIDTAFIGIAKVSYNQAEEMVKEKRRREATHED